MVGGEERGVGEDADYHRCWEAEGVGVICKGYLDEMMTLQHDRASDEISRVSSVLQSIIAWRRSVDGGAYTAAQTITTTVGYLQERSQGIEKL